MKIAIIPARGGSKRLPRKNILPINGHPMIAYPITVAIRSGLFDDVVVSTEDEEIASLAIEYGATAVVRPTSLAQDRSTVVEVCSHLLSLQQYKKTQSFCCLYATAIFVSVSDLIESNNILMESIVTDYVMGVAHYNYHPVQALKLADGYLRSMWPEYNSKQSQFYPELVVSNGTLYWAKVEQFEKDRLFYGEYLKGYVTRSVDIDTLSDYHEAQAMADNMKLSLY